MAKITDRALTQKAEKSDLWLYDGAINKGHGELCVRITPGGSRRFYFRYVGPNGKRERFSLGSYDRSGDLGLTVKAARLKAAEYSQLHESGIVDVKGHITEQQKLEDERRKAELARYEAERKAAEARLTVDDLFLKWQQQKLSKYKDGGKDLTRAFVKDVLPVIGDLPAESIRKGNIVEITDRIENRGANRLAKIVFSALRQMFIFAIEREYIEVDPTARLKKSSIGGKDVERERTLSEEEILLLAQRGEVSGLLPTAQAAIWICVSTCCRIGELLKARWEHVDLDKRKWSIPAENSKNGKAHEIHLSGFALKQFEVVRSFNPDSPWLYPNRKKDGHVCTKTITKQVGDRQRSEAMSNRSQNTETLKLPGGKWVMHDLRRTGATLMSMLGVAPVVIEYCLNHTEQNKVQRTYQRYSYAAEMKRGWDILGERLESLVGDSATAKVIPIKKKQKVGIC